MPSAMPGGTIIRAGRLVDGTGASARSGVDVWIRGGYIEAVHERSDLPAGASDDTEIIDAPGRTLLPGLIDSHVHLAFSAGDDPVTDLLADSDDRMLLRAAGNALVALIAGITTVRDAGDRHGVVLELRDAIRDGLFPGPRIVAAGMPITTTGGHCHWLGLEADTPADVLKAARRLHRMGADYFKVMATGGGMTPGSVSEKPQYSVEALKELVEEARRLGKTVAAHSRGTPGIRNAVAAGVTTIEHCSWLGPGRIEFDEAVAEEIVRQGIFVNATLGLAFRPVPRAWDSRPSRKATLAQLADRLAALRRQVELGTKMTAGTDAGIAVAPLDCLVQNVEVLVEHLGLTPLQGIRAATGLSAESMNLEQEIGTVAPGRRADLILVDGDPSTDVSVLRRVHRVFQSGRTVSIDGQLLRTPSIPYEAGLA